MMRELVKLWAGSGAVWLVLAVPAWLLTGPQALLDTAAACGLCLVPMSLTMAWAHWAFGTSPEQQLAAVMGGTGVRLLVTVAGSIGLYFAVEALQRPAFLIWVVVFYLATLALEVVLVVRRQNALADAMAGRARQPQP
jgi:hypothetical protein